MSKILVVAKAEYLNAVQSKAFLVGLAMMPIMMGGAFLVQHLTKGQVDLHDRHFAVIDMTGKLYPAIAAQAKQRNEVDVFRDITGQEVPQREPKFLPEESRWEGSRTSRSDVVLSEKVRDEKLFAYVIIGPKVIDGGSAGPVPDPEAQIKYHTETPTFDALPNWLEKVINDEARRLRFDANKLDQGLFAQLNQQSSLRKLGLVKVNEKGEVIEAEEQNRFATFGVPVGGMMLLFMLVMMAAPTTLNNVLEEKMQKIAEFLVSSVSPFELMLGKLLGTVFVAATLSVLYLGAVYGVTEYYHVASFIPWYMYAWFLLFELLALVIFGSIFSAIGAACSEMRDAQSLMTPAMILVMIPMFCFGPVLQSPTSTFSRLVSLFPPATPMIMFLRISIPPGPPVWEILLGVLLTMTFACGCVWAGGKVFRVGILSQGQAPTIGRLISWIMSR